MSNSSPTCVRQPASTPGDHAAGQRTSAPLGHGSPHRASEVQARLRLLARSEPLHHPGRFTSRSTSSVTPHRPPRTGTDANDRAIWPTWPRFSRPKSMTDRTPPRPPHQRRQVPTAQAARGDQPRRRPHHPARYGRTARRRALHGRRRTRRAGPRPWRRQEPPTHRPRPAACEQGRRVRYVATAQLVNELVEAADERVLSRVVGRLAA
ncbi:MAG: hypothetical protein V7646_5537 [Pseudonocardia sp.]